MPLVQVRQARAMALSETTDTKALMEANGGVYDIEQDPLWNGEQRNSVVSRAFDRKEMAFYQCDHLGTPQELTDHEGGVAWSAQYKAWGAAREAISEAGRRAGGGTRYGSRSSILMKRRAALQPVSVLRPLQRKIHVQRPNQTYWRPQIRMNTRSIRSSGSTY
ncbi:RHS domain-containing protein [Variovorax sp. GB1R11]|uniref:RHS domain-containing protein n=1 Tax=Variovorax sp. GB1R11 TaxID=3443741 RepID=UPI003F45AFD7